MTPHPTKPTKPILYFYRKEGCHLCDDMATDLAEFARERGTVDFEVIPRNIEDDENWYARYREYVPTLVLGEQEICYYFLDKDELREALLSR